ncbi:MAG: NUDIX hydrolase [Sediminibacterium sp.]|jgi:8-oxo-dGTP pyrophosphatase MutT (NUDIX family)|nr:NUDIX domain-containing protein [Chitinophagaceae bacterium]MCA6447195.1 NUDIX domain-containing protein [Chitinophagaceae bacterium]
MHKPIIIAAGGLVQNPSQEILLIFRRGFWDLPKGKLDPGETIEACAIREVEEETGLTNLTLHKFITITKHEYFDPFHKQDVIKESHWHAMTINDYQNGTPQTEEDITEMKWVSIKEIASYFPTMYPTIVDVINLFVLKQLL